MAHMATLTSKSEQQTMEIALKFAHNLRPRDVVFLEGELGAGKTVFVKGLAKAFHVDPVKVNSPTFVLMNIYEGKVPLYHFDLYRLKSQEELNSLQFDEFFYGHGISIVEWPQRLGSLMPEEYWLVQLSHKNEHEREICISYPLNPQRTFSL